MLKSLKSKIIILSIMGSAALLIHCNSADRSSDIQESEEDLITRQEINELQKEKKTERKRAEGNVIFSKEEFAGMKLFMIHCNRCHPGGEKGEGPSLNDKELPDFAIHFQVRQGLGDMPSFKKDQLSKDDIKNIILFVRILREIK